MSVLLKNVEWCYANLGWSFTPLNGKRPVLKNWQSAERENLEQAKQWAAKGNVGLRSGSKSGGLLIVDLDSTKEGYDRAAVKSLNLPSTVTAVTGSGGYHLYYKQPDGFHLGNRAKGLPPHVDIRGDGGQVVFPGSVHPDTGNMYIWREGFEPWNMPVADLPANLIEILKKPTPAAASPASNASEKRGTVRHDKNAEKYALTALQHEIDELRQVTSGRNEALNKASFALGQLVGGGLLDRSVVESALLGVIPLEYQERNRPTIKSGLDAGMKEPRSVPELPPRPPRAPRPASNANCGTFSQEPEFDNNGAYKLGTRTESGKLVLSAKKTLPTADAYINDFHSHSDGRTLHSYTGRLVAWRDNRYCEAEDGAIRNRLQPWLHDAVHYAWDNSVKDYVLAGFESNPSTVNNALETIRARVHIDQSREVPFWLSGDNSRPEPTDVLPCRTVNLHIPTGEVTPATPDLFTYNALDFDYDPAAPVPENWLKFIMELWGEDSEAIGLLQEWFGYLLTADTSQQKMLLIVGPKRSGKGTIGRVLTELIGRENVAGPTTGSLAGQFGLQPLLGKSLALVSDARFSGPDMQTVVERLLCISGEDTITVDRKHMASITQKLPIRFMFLSNELPRLRDAAGALAGRFLILNLSNSFFGKEDPELTSRLLNELPGILKWALQGWARLHERGRFQLPKSSIEAVEDLSDLASPVSAFVRERCVVEPGLIVTVNALYAAWCDWCEADGRSKATTRQTFGKDLQAAIPGLQMKRNHAEGRSYIGIALQAATLFKGGDKQ